MWLSSATMKPSSGGMYVKNIQCKHILGGDGKASSVVSVLKVVFIPLAVVAAKQSEDQEKIKKLNATTPRSWNIKQAGKSSIQKRGMQGTLKELDTKFQSERTEQIEKPRATKHKVVVGEEVTQLVIPLDRSTIIRACVLTSGGLATAGVVIRQKGWLSPDCTILMPYDFQPWHLGATAAAVVVVSVSRQLLLKTWPAFSRSSQAANEQVLKSLDPLDYVVVSVLPGISEELLFRGAVLPLFGIDWKGVLLTGIIFGALHLTGGRNKAFAIWASFIGILYGTLSVWTMDLLVPMATHSLANLVAAVMWKQNENTVSSEC
ncbi:hypothetical protein O6H91_13G066400 [Diphasiastrum complanatum]|uniref:Uncharacterized protein n=1 Tax=Diphasiastrum complanatum TaxID=34168 RepID=A0ACC2BVQ4_DIPCM|nr:hypothetical protein O6H91_13G066400 [Diphasiastrum complanatum]